MLAPGFDIHASQVSRGPGRGTPASARGFARLAPGCRRWLTVTPRAPLLRSVANGRRTATAASSPCIRRGRRRGRQGIRVCGLCRCSGRAAAASDAHAAGIPAARGAATGLRPRAGCRPGAEPKPIRDAEDVRVDRHRRLPERAVQHHVRGLATDARQFLQCLAVLRHRATVFLEQGCARRQDILYLAWIQPDRAHICGQAFLPECEDCRGRIGDRKQLARREVHSFVGCLRRENHGDSNSNGVQCSSSVTGCGFNACEALEEFVPLPFVHAGCCASSIDGDGETGLPSAAALRAPRAGHCARPPSARAG